MGSLVAGLVLEFAVAFTLVLTTVIALGLDGLANRKRVHPARASASSRPAGRVVSGRLSWNE